TLKYIRREPLPQSTVSPPPYVPVFRRLACCSCKNLIKCPASSFDPVTKFSVMSSRVIFAPVHFMAGFPFTFETYFRPAVNIGRPTPCTIRLIFAKHASKVSPKTLSCRLNFDTLPENSTTSPSHRIITALSCDPSNRSRLRVSRLHSPC